MKALITGGCGFLGSNIAEQLMSEGKEIMLFDNLSRFGAVENKSWLEQNGRVLFCHGDIRNFNDVRQCVASFEPDVILNLAGQVAMTTSLANPRLDFEVNTLGTFNVLEAIRLEAPNCSVIYSSTNKVYGDLEYLKIQETETRYIASDYPSGFNEDMKLEFHSPYGCSKGAAEQYIQDYYRSYGIKSVVFRHSSMYGGRQYATADQGWVGWFCQKFVDRDVEQLEIAGNGKQVRDLLHASDMKALYSTAIAQVNDVAGEVFNIGGGVDNSLSLLELFGVLGQMTGRSLPIKHGSPRHSDQKIFISDLTKVQQKLGWVPRVSYEAGLERMIDWTQKISEGG